MVEKHNNSCITIVLSCFKVPSLDVHIVLEH